MSENLYLRMHMLKCDMSEWLSDEPPEMLELLFATKNCFKILINESIMLERDIYWVCISYVRC